MDLTYSTSQVLPNAKELAKELDQLIGWRKLLQCCFVMLDTKAILPVVEEACTDYGMGNLAATETQVYSSECVST